MKNFKISFYIDVFIKLIVIIALIIAATTKQQYSYFTFLRWLVMLTFIYFTYKSYQQQQIGLLIFYLGVAIIFNPFQKFWFQKETWHVIDWIVAIFNLLLIFFEWKPQTSNKTEK